MQRSTDVDTDIVSTLDSNVNSQCIMNVVLTMLLKR